MSTPEQASVPQLGKLVSVVPVGLKEAALDSPTFRAATLHFADQIEFIERWLDGYARSATKLITELTSFEQAIHGFLSYAGPPVNVSEAILDHDYTQLAMKRYDDCAKDLWNNVIAVPRKLDILVIEPIRVFIQGELRNFKDTRRLLDQTQKHFDHLQARYSSQAKSKEPSSLREDAFQLHEARKAYLKASMDFSGQAPQLRNTLDKLLVRVSFDQWRETKSVHDNNVAMFAKCGQEMDRIKGWLHEMESSERYSRRELLAARKQIEEAAEFAVRPSRELDDYSVSTVPYLGSQAPSALMKINDKPFKPEKQGWLNLRILTGKPTRTVWVRRWAFLKNGIFGCLVQGSRTGGVEESERIGVLLCSIRPAFQEERRFCFEVKTKKSTIMLQAETQKDLMEWIGTFEAAKQKALDNPASTDVSVSGKIAAQDLAFSISQPPVPEFAADPSDSLTLSTGDDPTSTDRSGTLPVPERDGLAIRGSSDLSSARRPTGLEGEVGNGRDPASRIIQKLDLHRKSNTTGVQSPIPPSPALSFGGIVSPNYLHLYNIPVPPTLGENDNSKGSASSAASRELTATTLAPLTLANPPAPTNMSKAAVIVTIERGISVGSTDSSGEMFNGIMANFWGTSNWGLMNNLEGEGVRPADRKVADDTDLPTKRSASPMSDSSKEVITSEPEASSDPSKSLSHAPRRRHRQTVSLDGDAAKLQRFALGTQFEHPSYYPQSLRIQDAQFRLLFPHVKREESLVLVFRATWNPNDQQEFPGRAYVTTRCIYFYSHYFGLVLTTSATLASVIEVTAAPGRDCDFLFLHLIPSPGGESPGRITVKTFLEPLRLLQRRLNLLIKEVGAEEPLELDALLKNLMKVEAESPAKTLSIDSWEDISLDTPKGGRAAAGSSQGRRGTRDFRAPIYIDKDFNFDPTKTSRERMAPKFKLPSQAVQYVPQGNLRLAAEKGFDINPKALFHVLFGDKSAVWQLLLHERMAQDIKQGPWRTLDSGHMRRDFEYQIETSDVLGRSYKTKVCDYQIIDVLNDHLCYVITDKRTPWHLPFRRSFRLVSKIVITYVSKSRSKLAIFTKVEWLRSPYLPKRIVDKQASNDLEQDALDLRDLVSDQVRKLGSHSRTKKAITVFGHVGHQAHTSQFNAGDAPINFQFRKSRKPRTLTWLIWDILGSLLESAVSSLMIWTFSLLRWAWKTCTAHGVMLTLLSLSVIINGFYSSRDAYEWWQEKNAVSFMSRLGIGSNTVMSKAIYIRDIDETIANATVWHTSGDSSSCFATFHEQTLLDRDTPVTPGVSKVAANNAVWRLQRTRERLGIYRHDLVVALRVVNSIERELLQGEWEHWLDQETRRCRQIDLLLKSHDEDADTTVNDSLRDQRLLVEHREDVVRWYEDYCISCQNEKERVDGGVALD
jgi:hypothetical protein